MRANPDNRKMKVKKFFRASRGRSPLRASTRASTHCLRQWPYHSKNASYWPVGKDYIKVHTSLIPRSFIPLTSSVDTETDQHWAWFGSGTRTRCLHSALEPLIRSHMVDALVLETWVGPCNSFSTSQKCVAKYCTQKIP